MLSHTNTDTVGTGFSAEGAAAVIANVDGTSASVAAALETINSGTLPGQVPALALINAAADADVAVTTFQTDNKAAVDALVATLKAPASSDFETALGSAETYASNARVQTVTTSDKTTVSAGTDTTVLAAQGKVYDKAESDALAGLSSEQRALVGSYKSAVAAEAKAEAGQATDAEEAAAVAGLDEDTTAVEGLGKLGTPAGADPSTDPAVPATAQEVYDRYVNGSTADRSAIETALKGSDYYASFKAAAAKDAAYADATKATGAAEGKLTATDTTNTKAADYLVTLSDKTLYSEFLTKVVAADANVAAVKAIVDAYAVKVDAADTAHQAVEDFSAADVNIASLDGSNTAGTGDTVKDVFYFADKTAANVSADFKIDNFKAGDSIVLGSGYAFNNGALTSGDGNKVEFFLVKGDDGVQLVLETAKYGSSDITTQDATTGVIGANGSDHATVITLTGVTAEHVSVANGVVSYV